MLRLTEIDRKTWDEAISKHPEANFLQSWQYGDVQIAAGHAALRYEISMDNIRIGIAQIIIKNARRGRYMEIAGGPLIDWNNHRLVAELVACLRALGRENKCVFVRIRPQCDDDGALHTGLNRLGCRLSPMHVTADHTSIVDLTQSTEQLLANMRQQTRYEIKRAPKRGIAVTKSESSSFIDEFYEVQSATARRQGFIPPSKRYLTALYENFADHAKLYHASKGDDLLNLAIIIRYGREAAYLEAASTDAARREPGAYAIIWQAIEDAKSDGLMRFNLWGIAPPDSPNHRYAGVTTFKRGFGGQDIAYLAPHDIIVSPVRYQLNHIVESMRKKRRHL